MSILAKISGCESYGIERHQHLFAAWAASRAAGTVKGCRFKVEEGRAILEASGFNAGFSRPEQLPAGEEMDNCHRQWRSVAKSAAKEHGHLFTDGMAAKLINVYLKCRFVCGGHHNHHRVRQIHPPIDSILLGALAACNLGGFGKSWNKVAWSKLNSDQYENIIQQIRICLKEQPMWRIEEFWKGNQ